LVVKVVQLGVPHAAAKISAPRQTRSKQPRAGVPHNNERAPSNREQDSRESNVIIEFIITERKIVTVELKVIFLFSIPPTPQI
jgi:hypothetical protein